MPPPLRDKINSVCSLSLFHAAALNVKVALPFSEDRGGVVTEPLSLPEPNLIHCFAPNPFTCDHPSYNIISAQAILSDHKPSFPPVPTLSSNEAYSISFFSPSSFSFFQTA